VSGEPPDDPDIGEAVEYILAERPHLDEDDVWAVLSVIREPPAPGADRLALQVATGARPGLRRRDAKRILKEWRAYASLVAERDWDEEEL
jgi:hypothetical protein